MIRLRAGLLFTAILLAGCDHHKPADQAQASSAAVTQDDSDLTGMSPQSANSSTKVYPRAQLVSLPPAAAPAPTPAPSQSSKNPSPSPFPSETPATASTAPPPEPTPPPTPPPVPRLTPVADSASSRLTLNPPTPQPTPPPPTPVEAAPREEQVVVLKTSYGNIVIELDTAVAPRTCENFRKLVAAGFYNHTTFHRIIPDFIIQGGDPNSKGPNRSSYGNGGPGYKLPAEIKLTHDMGAVAMARLPDSVNPQRQSNGSQFYICLEACPSLDAKYTVFAHVIRGMEVANVISKQPHDSRDNPTDRIEMEAVLESKSKAMANDVGN